VGVPFVAADLVDRSLREADHVERVEAHLGLWGVGSNRFLVAAGHVDRDGADRLRSLGAELVEERLQRLGVATGRAPHDRAAAVVDDRGEVALTFAVGDLVAPDRNQAVQASVVEVIGDDALDDPTDRVPPDPQQASDRGLGHLLREPRDDVLEVARVMSVRPCPRHRLQMHTAVRAAPSAADRTR
jgi:hypothetical protein